MGVGGRRVGVVCVSGVWGERGVKGVCVWRGVEEVKGELWEIGEYYVWDGGV